jgi:hypothetical protein
MFRPALQDQRYFYDIVAVCDTRFMLYSQWAVDIINSNRVQDVCFLLGTEIYSPYAKWEN